MLLTLPFWAQVFNPQLFVPARPTYDYASPAPRAHLPIEYPRVVKVATTRGNFDAQKCVNLRAFNRSQYVAVGFPLRSET